MPKLALTALFLLHSGEIKYIMILEVIFMIRNAKREDMPQILAVYERARAFMRQTGNPTQWSGGYPQESLLLEDIEKGQLYLYETEKGIEGVFVFFLGGDKTYDYIEGAWQSDTPYGTIHRIASAGLSRGVFLECLNFCKTKIKHIRIDTHEDNRVMQNTLKKHGFVECGIIYLESGDPRLAFEYLSVL